MALLRKDIFLDSSMVEHSAVNRVVVGSSPTRGVFLSDTLDTPSGDNTRLHGQAAKTSPFHAYMHVKQIHSTEKSNCDRKIILTVYLYGK